MSGVRLIENVINDIDAVLLEQRRVTRVESGAFPVSLPVTELATIETFSRILDMHSCSRRRYVDELVIEKDGCPCHHGADGDLRRNLRSEDRRWGGSAIFRLRRSKMAGVLRSSALENEDRGGSSIFGPEDRR